VINDNTTNYNNDSNKLESANSLIPPLKIVPYKFSQASIKVKQPTREIVIGYQEKQKSQYIEKIDNINLELVKISAGKFKIGAIKDEYGIRILNTDHPNDVDVPEFYIGKYPVTQEQWKFGANLPEINRELGENPSNSEGEDLPVEKVSWEEAIEFCARLSHHTGLDYRLPSEAEWEYACRAEKDTPFNFGETIDSRLSNYNGEIYGLSKKFESRGQTTPIGEFRGANAYGLYDMHGNVKEWCQDSWHENYLNAPTDGSAWLTPESSKKVLRGGSYCNDPKDCRSDARCYAEADDKRRNIGFRLAMSVKTLVAPLDRSNYSDEVGNKVIETKIDNITKVQNNDGNAKPIPKEATMIDFAIITALDIEKLAVLKAFEIDEKKDRHRKDSRTYWRKRLSLADGKFYEIVVAQCLDVANLNAAILTNDVLHHWKPHAVIMVGIAATSKSSPKQNLGDLVVGREIYYYEMGKVTAEGKIPEPKQIPVDATLLDRVQALPKSDFLVLAERPDSTTKHPKIEIGVIASGDKVIGDEAERDKIADTNRKILAIEMEGYGVIASTWQSSDPVRCLVIRGLCDYADSSKNDKWHAYAAAVAADFTKYFLLDEPLEPRNPTLPS
jgi:formylglycine-generating enzyme required for sulfatase activity/nucleoside phosphorylase